MDFYKKKETGALHIAGATYESPYKAELEEEKRREQEEEQERTTRRASDRAKCDRIDGLKRKSFDELCCIHETLMLRAYAIHKDQPVAPFEPTTDERLLHLQGKYSLGFGAALFEYLTFKANTSTQHAMLRTPRNARGRVTSVTHVFDIDDHIQDLSLSLWQQEQRGDYRGVNKDGQPVTILHWLNKCYDNHFSGAATEHFAANKVSRQIHANESRADEKKPEYEEGAEAAPKRSSKRWGTAANFDSSPFSPLDPDKSRKLRAIVSVLKITQPDIANLLSHGLNKAEIGERLSIPVSKVTREIEKVRAKLEAAGITMRDMGCMYRTPNKRVPKPAVEAEVEVEAV
jgi:hypothetical protein